MTTIVGAHRVVLLDNVGPTPLMTAPGGPAVPHTPPSRIISLVAGTAVVTGVGMIPLHRLPRTVRISYIVLPAAFGAGATLAAQRRAISRRRESESDAPRRGTLQRATFTAVPFVVSGIIAGSGAASIILDRGLENLLRRRGVPAPRVAMGLASGALSLAMTALEDRLPEPTEELTSPPSAR